MPDALRAIFVNCTLKYRREISNTDALVDIVADRMKAADPNIEIDRVRMTDHKVKFGAMNDMGEGDEWPQILKRILAADIIVIATPI